MATENDLPALQKRLQKIQLQQEADQGDMDALARVTVRLCLASKGLDRELDSRLEPLQDMLKNSTGGSLQTKASGAEKALMSYFQRRDQSVQQTQDALRGMLTELWERAESDKLKSELDQLLSGLSETVENYGDYPQLLGNTGRMLSIILSQSSSATVQQDQNADDGGKPSSEAVDDETAEQLNLLCHRISSILLELLGQLSIPQKERATARKLIKQMETGFEWTQLSTVMDDVVGLILKTLVVRQADFENYLESLNLQLVDIQGFLVESRDNQKAHRESSQKLDLVVRKDVSKVETSLSQAESLDQLKSTVRLQLADIVKAMDHYRSEQDVREQQVGARMEQLQEKLETMEEQSVRMQAHLEEQHMRAISDPLTTLPNRAAYNERVEQEFSRQRRYQHPLAMVVCDLDHFKRINDNYGHLAGDKVLRLVAKLISGRLRDTDFVARYGGEEFVVLMPETKIEAAREVIEEVRQAVADSPFNFGGEPVQITMSFGITDIREADASHEDAFQRADDALYQAKQQGRNRSIVAPR
ncbi:MAG: GGDEF domain-containing protein [Halopseudomonas sp.]